LPETVGEKSYSVYFANLTLPI